MPLPYQASTQTPSPYQASTPTPSSSTLTKTPATSPAATSIRNKIHAADEAVKVMKQNNNESVAILHEIRNEICLTRNKILPILQHISESLRMIANK